MRMGSLWNSFRRFYWLLSSQFGIDPRKTLNSLRRLPRFILDYFRFRSSYTGRLKFMPCLHDRYEEGGATKSEYFWQDLLVARMIFEAKPEKHVDIGSRVDGFVAHVASFREIEIFDIRPITTQIPGVIFRQADFTKPLKGMENYCDSISCLHALEHFGLGRYGDTVDTKGYNIGFCNMSRLLKNNGIIYLSAPIGVNRVEFNAHRVFDPRIIVNLATQNSLKLTNMTVIEPNGIVNELEYNDEQLLKYAQKFYTLSLFVFRKCKK